MTLDRLDALEIRIRDLVKLVQDLKRKNIGVDYRRHQPSGPLPIRPASFRRLPPRGSLPSIPTWPLPSFGRKANMMKRRSPWWGPWD